MDLSDLFCESRSIRIKSLYVVTLGVSPEYCEHSSLQRSFFSPSCQLILYKELGSIFGIIGEIFPLSRILHC